MAGKGVDMWAAVLLLVSGVILLIPPLYTALGNLTPGANWVPIVIGILGIIVSLMMFAGGKGGTMQP